LEVFIAYEIKSVCNVKGNSLYCLQERFIDIDRFDVKFINYNLGKELVLKKREWYCSANIIGKDLVFLQIVVLATDCNKKEDASMHFSYICGEKNQFKGNLSSLSF